MILPKRPSRNSHRRDARICRSHQKWVRGFACSSCGKEPGDPENPIEAAHVRLGTNGGMGIKPSDRWIVSLCRECHQGVQHVKGERTFWRKLGILEPKELADTFARRSPYWPMLKDMP